MKDTGEIEFLNPLSTSLAGLSATTAFPTALEGEAELTGRVADLTVSPPPAPTPGNEWSKTNQSEGTPMKDIVEIELLNPLSTSLAGLSATTALAERPGLEGKAELTGSEGVGNPGPSGHSSEDARADEGITSESVQVQTPSASEGPAPSTDAADLPNDRAVADDTTEAQAPQPSEHSVVTDSTADSSSLDKPASDEEQAVPQLDKMELGNLLDETMGDPVDMEDFDGTVDDRAFENEWLGAHNDTSREAIREELLRTGRLTAHIDDADKLLSDPEEYRPAVDMKAKITLCRHRGWTEDQKREFILRSQTGKRMLTYEQQRELKNRLMAVRLRLGVDYKTIAKAFGVCLNTVRNFEKRAAADPNSNVEITQRPDGRFKPETQEKIAEAARLRKEGKSNAEIAKSLGTDVETVGKWLKDASAPDKAKSKAGGGKVKKTAATKPAQPIEDIAARDGVPELHRRALKHLKLDTQAYINWLKDLAAEIRQEVEGVSDIKEMQNYLLCSSLGMAFATFRFRKMLSGGGETDAEQVTAPRDSSPDKSGHEPDTILRGSVIAIEGDEVFLALPVGGGGVIDTRDDCLDWHFPPKVDEVVRVRVGSFDWKRGLWKLQPLGRQTPAPAPGAVAARSDHDDRCSPDTKLAGLKTGPKEKEVIL